MITTAVEQTYLKPSKTTLTGASNFHPRRAKEYLTLSLSVAPAIASSYSRAGVVINFVTATGGDVEMLRSIECFYK
jgi:hypothetical protein